MSRVLAVLAVSGVLWAVLSAVPVGALSLKVAPLEYRTELRQGEKKKGFIDVSNPTSQNIVIKTSAQAFRQVDDNGSLQFYDSEQLSAGVLLDLDEFELGPREAVRMYFQLDGTKLPSGDVFGAIFFTTSPATQPDGVAQAVRLGTLLSIVNGTPGARNAEVKSLNTSFIQLSDTITGNYAIKNTGDPAKTTGFYPQVKVGVWPFGEQRTERAKLVFAGRTRQNDVELKAPPFGFYKVSVGYGASEQSRWVFAARPIALIILFVVVFVGVLLLRSYKRHSRSKRRTLQIK